LDVIGFDRNLVVSPEEVNFGKGGSAGKTVGVVLYAWDWIPVRDGASVQGSIISTGLPTAVLGHEMEGGRQWTLSVSGCAVLQHGVELGLSHGQSVRIKAEWAAGYRRAGCCTYVMCGAVALLTMAPGW
jgi:hypothetical protein